MTAGWVINMNKKRSKTITIVLVIMIFGLMGTIFYITNILITPDATKSKIAARKSKAADITYSKDISLSSSSKLNPTSVGCPTDVKQCSDGSYVSRIPPNCEFAACAAIQPVPIADEKKPCADDMKQCSDGSNVLRIAPNCEFAACPEKPSPTDETKPAATPTLTVDPTTEPSPTDRILADNSSNSQSSSQSTYNLPTSSDVSPSVTPMTSLPQTGLVNNSIIVFGLSSLLLFFAFLY